MNDLSIAMFQLNFIYKNRQQAELAQEPVLCWALTSNNIDSYSICGLDRNAVISIFAYEIFLCTLFHCFYTDVLSIVAKVSRYTAWNCIHFMIFVVLERAVIFIVLVKIFRKLNIGLWIVSSTPPAPHIIFILQKERHWYSTLACRCCIPVNLMSL